MVWSGGNYTKGNNATGGWTGDASLGIGIEAGRHDTQDNDFATGIDQCLNKDGSNAATGNLNLGGFIPTNIGAGTAAAPALCAGNDVNTGIFSAAADQIGIATNGTERVRIDASGKVGIGTTSPVANLTVDNTSTVQGSYGIAATQFSNDILGADINLRKSRGATVGTNTIVQNGDVVGALRFWGANGTGYDQCGVINYVIDGTPGSSNDMPTALQFYTRADNSASLSERMRITSAGNVGIGTSAPTSALQVSGLIDMTPDAAGVHLGVSAVGGYASIELAEAAGGLIDFTTAGTDNKGRILYTHSDNSMSFSTNSAERMRIAGSGEIGMNSAPAGSTTLFIKAPGTSGSTWATRMENSANTGLFSVDGSGNIFTGSAAASPNNNTTGSGANVFVAPNGILQKSTSSARYKTDIRPYAHGLAEVVLLAPKFYKGINDGEVQFAGLIAEDVHDAGLTEFVVYNEDNEPDALHYGNMVALAFKAIQELNVKVDALEARVAELEA